MVALYPVFAWSQTLADTTKFQAFDPSKSWITTGALLRTYVIGTGSTAITTVGTITTGTWNAGVIPILYGGTGQTTANAGLNAFLPSQTGNGTKFLQTDGSNTSWATPAGSGTVTATGGALTANAVVLGAGTTDTKVSTGITTDGTAALNLGVNATTIGKLKMFGNTSGDATIQPTAAAGTATVQTLPATTGTLVNRVTTGNGVSASNTDGALSFTLGAITPTTVNGHTFTAGSSTFTGTAGQTYTFPTTTATIARTDAANTFTGIQTFSTAIAVGSGGTGVTSVTTTPAASSFAGWDANGNLSADNHIQGYTTTVTAAGTTALTANSTYLQFFTGTTTQTVTLPSNGTVGMQFYIRNNSTGAVTVNASGGGLVRIAGGGTRIMVTCLTASGTTAADWSSMYVGINITDGKILAATQSLTLSGTDATTMTFPTTSATIARTDAANTFTGVQTFSTPIAAGSVATMTATVGGGVPTPPNNTTTFLRGDGTFAAPAGGGSGDLVNGGQSTAATVSYGTTDANAAAIKTNSVTRFSITGGASTGGAFTATDVTANTNTVETMNTYVTNSSGTAATGLGLRNLYQLETTTTNSQDAASIDAVWSDATHASRTGDLVFSTVASAGSLTEALRIGSTDYHLTTTAAVANTNTVNDRLIVRTNSTGTAAASFGGGILFQGESSTTDNQDMARISSYWTSATHATREAAVSFQIGDNAGAIAEVMKLDRATASTGGLSIGSTTPVVISNNAMATATTFTVGNSSNPLTLGGSTGNVTIQSAANGGAAITLNPSQTSASSTNGIDVGASASHTQTSGTRNFMRFSYSFAPTFGTAVHNQLIFDGTLNQTGGANGIIRGINIAHTMTAVADYRAIEIADNLANTKGIYQTGSLTTNNFVGKTTFGATTTPTAYIMIAAGTSTVPAIQQTPGTLNTVASGGAYEYSGSHYQTKSSGLRYAEGGVIADHYTDVANSGTGETDIYTYTTPASTLAADGEKISFSYTLNLSDITATAQIKVYFAATAIANTGALTVSATGAVIVSGWIVRTSATTARASVNIASPSASTAVYTAQTDLTSLTLSGTNILKCTAQSAGAGGGSSDITGKSGTVSWSGVAAN